MIFVANLCARALLVTPYRLSNPEIMRHIAVESHDHQQDASSGCRAVERKPDSSVFRADSINGPLN